MQTVQKMSEFWEGVLLIAISNEAPASVHADVVLLILCYTVRCMLLTFKTVCSGLSN